VTSNEDKAPTTHGTPPIVSVPVAYLETADVLDIPRRLKQKQTKATKNLSLGFFAGRNLGVAAATPHPKKIGEAALPRRPKVSETILIEIQRFSGGQRC
jgi:hypothetical protein